MKESNSKEKLNEALEKSTNLVNNLENDTKRLIDVDSFKSHTKSEYDNKMEELKKKVRKEIEIGCDLIQKSKDEGQIDKNMKELFNKIDEQFIEGSKESEQLKEKVKKAA